MVEVSRPVVAERAANDDDDDVVEAGEGEGEGNVGRETWVAGGQRWSLRRWPVDESERGAALGWLPLFVGIHGFAGAGDDFEPLIRGPAAIPGEWVTVDVVGHGRSAAPECPTGRRYAMASVAGALSELLAAALSRPYILVGYSMGGRLALSAMLGPLGGAPRPRPLGLVLVGATLGIADGELRAERRRADETLASQILERGIAWFAEYWGGHPVLAGKRRIAVAHRRAMDLRLLHQRPEGLAGSLRGMGTGAMPPLWESLRELEVPTLLVTGVEDPKFTAIASEIRRDARQAEAVVLARAGHTAHLEAPAVFAAELEGWRRRCLPPCRVYR